MAGFFAALVVLSFACFVGAMVKPSLFVRWGNGTRKGGLAYLGAMFVFIVIGSALIESPADNARTAPAPSGQAVAEQAAVPEKVAAPLKEVEFSMDVEAKDQKPYIVAYSNLPDGTKLMATITAQDDSIMGQSNASLKGGMATFGPFSQGGEGYDGGKYTASVTSPLWSLQPEDVQRRVDVANLTGDSLDGEGLVRFSASFTVEGVDKEALVQADRVRLKALFDELLVLKRQQQFRVAGLGGGNPAAHDWLSRVTAFRKELSTKKGYPFELEVAPGYLQQLAFEYVNTKGRDTAQTRRLAGHVREGFQ